MKKSLCSCGMNCPLCEDCDLPLCECLCEIDEEKTENSPSSEQDDDISLTKR